MVTTLSDLVEVTQGTAVPEWLQSEVLKRKDEIAKSLSDEGSYTLVGPQGQQVVIRAERKSVAAGR